MTTAYWSDRFGFIFRFNRLLKYVEIAVALLVTTICEFAINAALPSIPHYVLFTLPVAFAAYISGFFGGLLTAIASVLIIDYFFLPPAGFSLHLQSVESVAHLVAFIVEASAISIFTHRLQKYRRAAELAAHKAEESLDENRRQQRIKDEFLTLVSHELRTPTTSVNSWLQLLKSGRLNAADSNRALEAIDRGVKSQVRLIEDLLDVSRIAAGKLTVATRPLELVGALKNTYELCEPLANSKNVQITFCTGLIALPVMGDSDRLQQAVCNLLANAIKFTPAGGRVTLTIESLDKTARIRIADTGIGIEPSQLCHLFDRFWQAEDSPSRSSGLGLGLAITKYIVEKHNGTVEAFSAGKGKGSEFVIVLPIQVQAPSAAQP